MISYLNTAIVSLIKLRLRTVPAPSAGAILNAAAPMDHSGRMLAEGRPDDVLKHPEVIRAYLGSDIESDDREASV